jgi:hypothetical protein
MECKHCGFTQAVKMPVPIDDMLTQFDAFAEAHKGCTAPQSETVTPEYIIGWGMGFAELTNAQKAERYWKAAEALDKKGDEYFAAGNLVMAKACRERALLAANRAVRYSKFQGFDGGYVFVLNEIEQYIKRHDYEPLITGPLLNLLAFLKAGDKAPQK